MSKRTSDTQRHVDRPWTTARLNVHYRKFKHALDDLKEKVEETRRIQERSRASATTNPSSCPATSGHAPEERSSESEFEGAVYPEEPEWASEGYKPRRSLKRTYSALESRRRKLQVSSSSNGSNTRHVLPVEARRTRLTHPSQSLAAQQVTEDWSSSTCIYDGPVPSSRHVDTTPEMRVSEELGSLLRHTEPGGSDRNVSSLVDMCFRAVPKAIKHEEEQRKLEDVHDKSDVAAEVAQELLERPFLGYPSTRHMAVVVRARGIFQIQEAIRNDVIGVEALGPVMTCCADAKCFREMDAIASTLYAKQDRHNLKAFKKFNTQFVYGHFVRAYGATPDHTDRDLLPLSHLRRALRANNPVWPEDKLVDSIGNLFTAPSLRATGGQASFLLQDVIESHMKSKLMKSKLLDKRWQMCTFDRPIEGGDLSLVIGRLVVKGVLGGHLEELWPIQANVALALQSDGPPTSVQLQILLANVILNSSRKYADPDRQLHLRCFSERLSHAAEYQISDLIIMLLHAADFFDLQSTQPPFGFLTGVLETLLDWREWTDSIIPAQRQAIRSLVLKTALESLGGTRIWGSPSAAYRKWVHDLEENLTTLMRAGNGSITTLTTPGKPALTRWEPSLCEWVAITPATVQPLPVNADESPSIASPTPPQQVEPFSEAEELSPEDDEPPKINELLVVDGPYTFDKLTEVEVEANEMPEANDPPPQHRASSSSSSSSSAQSRKRLMRPQLDGSNDDDFDDLPSSSSWKAPKRQRRQAIRGLHELTGGEVNVRRASSSRGSSLGGSKRRSTPVAYPLDSGFCSGVFSDELGH